MELKFKKLHKDAVTPRRATEGSNGFDLTAISKSFKYDDKGELLYISYDTGLSFAVPEGYVGLLFARSSVSNIGLSLANGVGVGDQDFRGSISFRFYETNKNTKHYAPGDRIGQLVIVAAPSFELNEVDTLDDTARGAGGYGSTS